RPLASPDIQKISWTSAFLPRFRLYTSPHVPSIQTNLAGTEGGMLHKLTQADLRRAAPGLYADGGNLYLQVTANGEKVNRSWIFRFAISGKRREMGLGPVHTIGLKGARAKA